MNYYLKLFSYGVVLSAVATGSVFADNDKEQQMYNMRKKVVESNLYVFKSLFDSYKQDTSAYPTTDQGFKALLENPLSGANAAKWQGPYLKEVSPDPWGHPYQYQRNADGNIEIFSFGRDGKIDGQGMDKDIKLSDFK
jgi:general secretion pathway protein G